MNLENEIKDFVSKKKLCELENLLIKIKIDDFRKSLIKITFESESIVSYSLVCMMLMKHESVELHQLAIDLLVHPLCIIEGAYTAALYHARKAINISPDDVDLKESLLFFHNVPDKLVSKEEAITMAKQILEKEKDNKSAKELLDRYRIKR